MIPGLDTLHAISEDAINDAMFLSDSSAPATGESVSQRLGFPDSLKGVGEDRSHQIENTKSNFAVRFNPAPQILLKVGSNDSDPLLLPGHCESPLLVQANEAAEFIHSRLLSLATVEFAKRCKQSPGVRLRTQQVRGLVQARQFIGSDDGHMARAAPLDNHNLTVIDHAVQIRRQILAQLSV